MRLDSQWCAHLGANGRTGPTSVLKRCRRPQHATLEVRQMSGSLFECEWAGVEVVIGPNRFGLGCCWVQIQWAGFNLHTHGLGFVGLCELMGLNLK